MIKATRPNIFFLCMHKAASTFVADVLLQSISKRSKDYEVFNIGSLLINYLDKRQKQGGSRPKNRAEQKQQLDEFLQEQPVPSSNCLVGRLYSHHWDTVSGYCDESRDRVMVMRRDPRDALVSLYYSLAISHDLNATERGKEAMNSARTTLASQGVRDGLKTMLTKSMNGTITEFLHCTDLIASGDNVIDLPYEMLINDRYQWLHRFVKGAGLSDIVNDRWIEEMANHLTPPEKEDPTSHKRRMRPGNWVDVFDDELKDMVTSSLGGRLEQFGYAW